MIKELGGVAFYKCGSEYFHSLSDILKFHVAEGLDFYYCMWKHVGNTGAGGVYAKKAKGVGGACKNWLRLAWCLISKSSFPGVSVKLNSFL